MRSCAQSIGGLTEQFTDKWLRFEELEVINMLSSTNECDRTTCSSNTREKGEGERERERERERESEREGGEGERGRGGREGEGRGGRETEKGEKRDRKMKDR